jgi:superfamily II DNA or RNA helicase
VSRYDGRAVGATPETSRSTTSTAYTEGARVNDPIDPRRRFAGSERAELFLSADGRCKRCGVELGPDWHADHVIPHARGGATDIANGQALCPPCNLSKGASVSELRKWQADALKDFDEWRATANLQEFGFLVEATPGAGKTRLAIEIARRLLESRRIGQVVIAVPTSSLEKQWAKEFHAKAGLNINPDWRGEHGALAADVVGCAVTYAEVPFGPESFKKLVDKVPTLVVLDEVHHCGDTRHWGAGVREAFGSAAYKLLLSGTPYRSDDNAIPFLAYEPKDGAKVGKANVQYGYRKALGDGVVRSVFFPRRGGTTEWEWDGARRTASFDDSLDDREANKRLRTALARDGEWLPSVLRDADRQLTELRTSDPKAAGIVFCETTEDADAVAGLLRAIGRQPVVAVSSVPGSSDLIGDFRGSYDPWIVTIRQVSEGVDIPRLRVGVYATTWLTQLFFVQVVGRLVRTDDDEEDPTSYLFIPDDERIRALAQTFKEARDHEIERAEMHQPDLFDSDGGGSEDSDGSRGESKFRPISSSACDMGTIVDDVTLTPGELSYAAEIKRISPETASMSTEMVGRILRNAGMLAREPAPAPGWETEGGSTPHFERMKDLRRKNNRRVAQISKAYGIEYSVVRGTLNTAVGLPRKGASGRATETQLKQMVKFAREWHQTGMPPSAGG